VAAGHPAILGPAELAGAPVVVPDEAGLVALVRVLRGRQHFRTLGRRLEIRDLFHVVRVADVEEPRTRAEAAAAGDLSVVGVVDLAVVAGRPEAGAAWRW